MDGKPKDLSPGQKAALVRLMKTQRVIFWMFTAGMIAWPGGFVIALFGVDFGAYLYELGLMDICLLLLVSCTVIPCLKCPRCGNRFFLPNGFLGFLSHIHISRRECIHCGLTEMKTADTDRASSQL